MSEAMETLKRRFTSGNNIPVTQAKITRDEYESLRHQLTEANRQVEELEKFAAELVGVMGDYDGETQNRYRKRFHALPTKPEADDD